MVCAVRFSSLLGFSECRKWLLRDNSSISKYMLGFDPWDARDKKPYLILLRERVCVWFLANLPQSNTDRGRRG